MTSSGALRSRFAAAVLLILCLDLFRHAVLFFSGPAPIVYDASQYWSLGGKIADGDWLQLKVAAPYRTPVYPYFVALNRVAAGKYALMTAVLWQHAFVFATSIITGLIAARLCGNRWAFVVGYAANLLFTARLWYAGALLTDTLFTLCFTIAVFVFLTYLQSPRLFYAIVAGLSFGLATDVRPITQLLTLVLAVMVLLGPVFHSNRVGWRTAIGHACAFLITFGMLLLPCFIRNKVIYDEFFFTKLPAVNKWAVTFHPGSCADLSWPDTPAARQLTEQLGLPGNQLDDRYSHAVKKRLLASGLKDAEAEQLMSRVALDAIRQEPRQFLWKALKRMLNYWRCIVNWPPYGGDGPREFMGQFVWRLEIAQVPSESLVRYSPARSLWWNQLQSLAAWVAVGVLSWRRETRLCGVSIALILLYFCGVTGLVEIENYRYRMILEPLVIVAITMAAFPPRQNSPANHGSRSAVPPIT